jgi:hypothetical protein
MQASRQQVKVNRASSLLGRPVPRTVHGENHDGVKVATVVRVGVVMHQAKCTHIPSEVLVDDEVTFGLGVLCQQGRVLKHQVGSKSHRGTHAEPKGETDGRANKIVSRAVIVGHAKYANERV